MEDLENGKVIDTTAEEVVTPEDAVIADAIADEVITEEEAEEVE